MKEPVTKISGQSTSFQEMVKSRMSVQAFEDLKNELGSAHARTKLLNNPAEASNHQLLLFAKLLDLPAFVLWRDYQLGRDQVSEIELEQHRLVYERLSPASK